jgi:hypothetical protein
MVTLRCTAKLLGRLGIEEHPPEPPPPTNALGDWYADILYTRPAHLVLFLSERSGLGVIVEARRLDTLGPRFLHRLEELLTSIGVPSASAERELAATQSLAFGATTNRSARALLNSAVQELKFMLPLEPQRSVHEWSTHFASRPCGNPLRLPKDVAHALLSPAKSFTLIRGGAS